MPIIKFLLKDRFSKTLPESLKKYHTWTKRYLQTLIKTKYLYYCIILFAFLIRVYNLDYNSPFSDEAIYIVIGKLGVFQGDWWSYNAVSWMGGSPFFYPTISAISSVTGGIIGSRLLNVVFGVLTVETIFRITIILNDNKKIISGLMSAAILSFSATAIYVSRLATYDMPSYFFAVLGFYLLLLAEKNTKRSGKYYFLSSLSIIFAVLTKIITAIYLPIIFVYSYESARRKSKKKKLHFNRLYFWKRYFIPPLLAGIFLYLTTYMSSIVSFFNLQFEREKVEYLVIVSSFINYLYPSLILFAVASLGFVLKKAWKSWFYIIFLAAIPLVFHLASERLISLDKHAFMSLIFLSIGIGIGLDKLYSVDSRIFNPLKSAILTTGLAIFTVISLNNAGQYNQLWQNSNNMLHFVENKVKKDDLILAENGPEVILATYNTNFPLNTTTFDYFDYKKSTDLESYRKAVLDGYFNLIEIETNNDMKTERFNQINDLVLQAVEENYKLAYSDEAYQVYLRRY
jgi:hypothetical protein